MFEIENVTRRYADCVALDSVSLTIAEGQTTVLIGPSGSGKSTLLKLMPGLVIADSGIVRFKGRPLDSLSILSERRKMGYVVQEGGLFPHMTARENVTLMSVQLGWKGKRVQHRLDELVALTQFPSAALQRYPSQLSGGQRQRVSLMRALMLDPDVLLLDEPLGALDPMIRYELQNDLKTIFTTLEKTVVMVTHDIAEAGFFADTIVLMNAGNIVQAGMLKDLVDNPASHFVQRFITAQRAPLESLRKNRN